MAEVNTKSNKKYTIGFGLILGGISMNNQNLPNINFTQPITNNIYLLLMYRHMKVKGDISKDEYTEEVSDIALSLWNSL